MVGAAEVTTDGKSLSGAISINDDDFSIDNDQLEEYREEVEQLGSFPVSSGLVSSREIAFLSIWN